LYWSEIADPFSGFLAVQKDSVVDGFHTQHHVFRDGENRHQHEVLVHHADAQTDRIVGLVNLRLLAADKDFAGIGLIQSVEDVHQRRFAGAVFAQQGVDFPLFQRQVNVVVGEHAGEGFGDPAEF